MKRLNKRELQSLRKEVSAEIKEIKRDIKAAEKADEFSHKVDRLYDRLEGNELLLDAIDNTISNISSRLDDKGWEAVIDDFKNAVEFADNNKASFSSRDVLDRVLISDANENKRVSRRFNEASDYAQERYEKVNVSDIKISEGKSREFRVNSSAGYISLSAECPVEVVLRSFNNDDIELSENDAEVFIKLRIDSDMEEEIKELSDEAKKRWVDFSSLWITSRRGMDGILRTTSADNTIYTLEVKDVDETIDVDGVEFEVIGAGMAFDGRQVGATFDELVDMINDEYDEYDESVKRTRASRESRFYEGTVSARTLSGLFRSLKNDHPNTTVAKQSSGMIWKGDVLLHIRNAGWNESGDWIDLGFSLSPDKSQLTVYETKSGKKEIVTSVNQFQEALESLGVRASVIDSITRYL